MKIYNLLAGITVTILSSTQSIANETSYGIGAAVNDDLKIYFPIKTGSILIEPSLVYLKSKNESTDPFSFTSDDESIQIGIGVFSTDSLLEKTNIYYGARVGYIKTDITRTFSSPSISTDKSDGYFISPTIGAEYYLTSNLSLGLDVSISYTKTEGDSTRNLSGTTEKFKTKNSATTSAAEVIIRYHF